MTLNKIKVTEKNVILINLFITQINIMFTIYKILIYATIKAENSSITS